jgi:hypothetical protein
MKLEQIKIPVNIEGYNWKLVRERDELTKYGVTLGWIEWDKDDKFKQLHDKPEVDRSLMLDPHLVSFTWQTTTVTEIVEERNDYIKFKTKNSTYELWKLS